MFHSLRKGRVTQVHVSDCVSTEQVGFTYGTIVPWKQICARKMEKAFCHSGTFASCGAIGVSYLSELKKLCKDFWSRDDVMVVLP